MKGEAIENVERGAGKGGTSTQIDGLMEWLMPAGWGRAGRVTEQSHWHGDLGEAWEPARLSPSTLPRSEL